MTDIQIQTLGYTIEKDQPVGVSGVHFLSVCIAKLRMKANLEFVSSFTFEVERGRTEEGAWREMDVEMVLRRSQARLEFARKGIAELEEVASGGTGAFKPKVTALPENGDIFTLHEVSDRDTNPPKWSYPQASSSSRQGHQKTGAEEKAKTAVHQRQERSYMWQWSPSESLRSDREKEEKKRRRKKREKSRALLVQTNTSSLAPENQRELSEAGQIAILCNFVAMIRSGRRKLFGVPISTLQSAFHAIDMHRYNLTLSDRGRFLLIYKQPRYLSF